MLGIGIGLNKLYQIAVAAGGTPDPNDMTITWLNQTFNPVDSTEYYFACGQDLVPSTGSNGNRRHKLPVATSAFTLNIGLASNGSTEGVTWRIRNITQGTQADFDTTHSWTSGGQANAWNGTATLSCDADDYISVTCVTPAWTTNPTSVRIAINLHFQDGV
jgi:hypothetical protein